MSDSYLVELPSGDTQCPKCGLINPEIPEGKAEDRCDYCIVTVWE